MAHNYNYRVASKGLYKIVAQYAAPAVTIALLLNVPKIIDLFPIATYLEDNLWYLQFLMFYQVLFHKLFPYFVSFGAVH